MDKKERLNKAYNYLKSQGVVHTQKDVSEKMGATAPNVSSALKGVDAVLTDKFLSRFNEAFGNIFSDEWLISGIGDMLRPSQSVSDINNSTVVGANVQGNGNNISNNDAMNIAGMIELQKGYQAMLSKSQAQIDELLSQNREQFNRFITIIEQMNYEGKCKRVP